MAYFVLFLVCGYSKITIKNVSVGCVVKTKKNRQMLRDVLFIGNLKYSSDRTLCLQSRLSGMWPTEKTAISGSGARRRTARRMSA